MAFLTPLALALGLLSLPILVLYMLKLRRQEVEISSTLLWQKLLRDREANAPWQRLRRNLLLFVQLALLALLVLALARPFVRVPAVASGTLVVLLDASASMRAGDVEPSRFEAARAAARQLIDGLRTDGRMSLILVGRQPEVLASAASDKLALRQALAGAQPGEGPADWEAAVALAAGAVRQTGAVLDSTVIIISDGGLPESLPPLSGEVRYVPVGNSADNLALEALALRPAQSGLQLFARVANYGDADRAVIVSTYADGQLFNARQLDVPADGGAEMVLPDLPLAPAVYEARLSLPVSAGDLDRLDDFPLDDQAWAVYQPASAGRALLVSPGNVFLEQVLAAMGSLQPFRLAAGAPLPAEPFDLYAFDGVVTDTLPAADLLLINSASNDLFEAAGVFTNTRLLRVASDDPLMRYVDWSQVHVLRARQVTPPAWARVLVQAEGGPLVLAGEVDGRRVAALTFDLHDSDLPLQVAYPILMANLIDYLAPAQAFSAPDGLHPGEVLAIQTAGGDQVISIQAPTGQRFAAPAGEAGVLFADTRWLGVYTVSSSQRLLGSFAVNLFSPGESDIRPQAFIRIGRAEVEASARGEQGQLEFWPWLAAGAFGLLAAEWWLYHRGATLPAAPGWRGWLRRRKTAP